MWFENLDQKSPDKIRLKDLNGKHARALVRWLHGADLARGFPYARGELHKMQIADLRFIARLIPDFVQREVFNKSKQELTNWIIACQPQVPVPPLPPPIRIADVSLLEDIRPPRR